MLIFMSHIWESWVEQALNLHYMDHSQHSWQNRKKPKLERQPDQGTKNTHKTVARVKVSLQRLERNVSFSKSDRISLIQSDKDNLFISRRGEATQKLNTIKAFLIGHQPMERRPRLKHHKTKKNKNKNDQPVFFSIFSYLWSSDVVNANLRIYLNYNFFRSPKIRQQGRRPQNTRLQMKRLNTSGTEEQIEVLFIALPLSSTHLCMDNQSSNNNKF